MNVELAQTQLELEKQMLDLGEKKFRATIGKDGEEFDSVHIQKIVKDMIEPFSEIISDNVNQEREAYLRGHKAPIVKLSEKEVYTNRGTKKDKDGNVIELDATILPIQISFIVIRSIFICLREDDKKRMMSAATVVGKALNSNIIKEDRFSDTEYIRIGTVLINLLITSFPKWFKTEVNVAGILTSPYDFFERDSKNKEYLIIPSEEFLKMCENIIEGIAEMATVIFPMIEKPEPWTEFGQNGGFFSPQLKKNIIKRMQPTEHSGINKTISGSINAVASTPWMVNDFVNGVMVELNKSKPDTLAKTFPLDVEATPAKPYGDDLKYADMDEEQKKEHQLWSRRAKKLTKDRQAKKSIDMAREASLIQAGQFKSYPKIYFPHDLDYRKRLYNMCMTGLNTQGADVQKGLIKFATPRQVETENGVRWMKINMANLIGFDKLRLDERVRKCNEHEDIIRDVVKNPLGCTLWHSWDKPIQGLAAAFEYVKWLNNDQAYLNLHVQLDGLCNGVQNLAAITKDHTVAPHVGLVWTPERGDVYQYVIDDVIKQIGGTCSMADEWLLSELLDRSLSKTPVMTRSYGAKLYGIKEGVQDYIDSKCMSDHFTDSFKAGNWMGEKIWHSMDASLSGPMQFMNWVQSCAGIMAKANLPLIWTNPVDGLCKQSPMVTKKTSIEIKSNGTRIQYYIQKPTGKISKPKSESSSSPNLIHSCDGGHLTGTTDICISKGIKEFAMVHDSFGSAPDDAATLLHSAKLAWVKQYGGNVNLPRKWFEQWTMQGLEKGITLDLPKPEEFIKFGTLKAEEVMKSEFFFA
jgi:DNA-directed RNA polymerase